MTNNEEANAKDDLASSTLSRIKELGFDWQEIGSLGGKSRTIGKF